MGRSAVRVPRRLSEIGLDKPNTRGSEKRDPQGRERGEGGQARTARSAGAPSRAGTCPSKASRSLSALFDTDHGRGGLRSAELSEEQQSTGSPVSGVGKSSLGSPIHPGDRRRVGDTNRQHGEDPDGRDT